MAPGTTVAWRGGGRGGEGGEKGFILYIYTCEGGHMKDCLGVVDSNKSIEFAD